MEWLFYFKLKQNKTKKHNDERIFFNREIFCVV